MDPVQHKLYHVHQFHSRNFLDTYCANKPGMIFEEEGIKLPMEKLHYYFRFANIEGGLMIDLSIGPVFFHLYSACEYFREIILLKFNDHCIIEVKRWLHGHTGAFDWKHTSSFVAEKEGNSSQSEEKDKRLKAKIKHVLKCCIDKENITDPLQLPPADCLFIGLVLDVVSKDKDEYIRNLKLFTKLLKPDGHLILFGLLHATYFTLDGEKFHVLEYDKSFLITALEEEGYSIRHCEVQRRRKESDLSDFKAVVFVAARKEEED
ncbi:PREDICTED: nicotinamide N-methyltransferase-like [Nanorana parkeri]|uniref:nicotinamide N-methyltransferase-like n=1 Tax=Nanorana parkeri TaxID=125878 RepID=UPI00085454A3|nr:PREDICTED: nicotinamide N-methyltransferase-like [Nanorana parkeri]